MSFTKKNKRFCEEYVIDLNGKQAAIRAGYSEKTAEQQASRLLRNVKVKDCIKTLQAEIVERNKITIDECVSTLASMSRFDIIDLYNDDGTLKPLKDIPKEARLVIEGLDTDEIKMEGLVIGYVKKLKISNRRSNIIELMKYLGAYEIHNKQKQPDKQNKDYSKLTDKELIQLSKLEQKINSHD